MNKSVSINKLEDYFLKINERNPKGIYFYRIVGYDNEMLKFLGKYHGETMNNGMYLKEGLSNPSTEEGQEFLKKVGNEVRVNKPWLEFSLKNWIPSLDSSQLTIISESLFEELTQMKASGSSVDILKNTYIKFMVWLKYRLKSMLYFIGKYSILKILYQGTTSKYELYFLNFISRTGVDILLVNFTDDSGYLKIDPSSQYSKVLTYANKGNPPIDFAKYDWTASEKMDKIRNGISGIRVDTNTKNPNTYFADSIKTNVQRGGSPTNYYNYFIYTKGVEKEQEYVNQLYRWKQDLEKAGSQFLIIENKIPNPSLEEVNKISKKQVATNETLVLELCESILFSKNREWNTLVQKALFELLEPSLHLAASQLKNVATCIVCWFERYFNKYFLTPDKFEQPVFIYLGSFSGNEALFFQFLSKLPIDVFIFSPMIKEQDRIDAPDVIQINFENSATIEEFPKNDRQILFTTAAREAEEELTDILYTGTGLYRENQFLDSRSIVLQTTYEEIDILWNQEAKFRPGFEEFSDKVMVPTIFAKVCGVKDGNLQQYWKDIRSKVTANTILMTRIPSMAVADPTNLNAYRSICKNGIPDLQKLREHTNYKYEYLSSNVQNYLLSKLQELLEPGRFKNAEDINAKIVALFLTLDKKTIQFIQKYDFTKEIPKVIVVHTTEIMCSLEDCIYIAFLSLVGFDILIFTPTGYQTLDKYFSPKLLVNHIIGEYMFDLNVPSLNNKSANQEAGRNFLDRVFGKGRS